MHNFLNQSVSSYVGPSKFPALGWPDTDTEETTVYIEYKPECNWALKSIVKNINVSGTRGNMAELAWRWDISRILESKWGWDVWWELHAGSQTWAKASCELCACRPRGRPLELECTQHRELQLMQVVKDTRWVLWLTEQKQRYKSRNV